MLFKLAFFPKYSYSVYLEPACMVVLPIIKIYLQDFVESYFATFYCVACTLMGNRQNLPFLHHSCWAFLFLDPLPAGGNDDCGLRAVLHLISIVQADKRSILLPRLCEEKVEHGVISIETQLTSFTKPSE